MKSFFWREVRDAAVSKGTVITAIILLLLVLFAFVVCMGRVISLQVCLCTVCMQCLWRPERAADLLGATDGCELPYGF